MAARKLFLSESERRILLKLAEVALPAGRVFPAAGKETVEKTENFFGQLGKGAEVALRAGLWRLEYEAIARAGGRFSRLSSEKRLKVLDAWYEGDALSRNTLRLLLTPLKTSYLGDPARYKDTGCRYEVELPSHMETFRWQQNITDAREFDSDEELECDVVVVGTGAGGAPVAKELAEKGLAVLMLEEGDHFTRMDFNGRALEAQRKMYRNSGATVALGNHFIPIPVGKTVGGSTTINSGTCFRLPESTMAYWRNEMGLHEFTAEMMDEYFEKVEKTIQVEEAKWEYIGGPGRVIARGSDALGYSHKPLKRNAPECDGQGLCCFGCPTDAKRSTNVSYVPEALKSAAQLMTGVRVTRVLTQGDKATGVEGVIQSKSGKRVKLTVRAKVVVLSCGTFYTPTLLMKQGICNSSGQLGKNLAIHPASQAMAWFPDEDIHSWDTIPQGYSVDHFKEEGLMFEGGTTPFDMSGAALTLYGKKYTQLMENYNHIAMFGIMVKDTSRGQVRLGPGGMPLILYWVNKKDRMQLQRGMEILSRIYFAAGAKEVYPGLSGWEVLRSTRDVDRMAKAKVSVNQFDVSAYHPLGTCIMGNDPRKSVVGTTHETHDLKNLYICDGSAVPSSLGVNPQVTIMALATRASEFIARRVESLYGSAEAA